MFSGKHDKSSLRSVRRLRFSVIALLWCLIVAAALPIAITTIPAAIAHRNSHARPAALKQPEMQAADSR